MRFFASLFGIIVLILVVGILILFFSWSRIPDFVAHQLSKKMKVEVEIDAIDLSWDRISVEKLDIGNPPGSVLQKALSVNQINIDAPLSRYLDEQIIIDEIKLDDVYVGIEFDSPGSKKGNWTKIMQNLSPPGEKAKKGKIVFIKRLILNNISIDLAYRSGRTPTKHLAPISHLEFKNVSSEKGIPSQQIANIILQQTLKSIFTQENLQNMIEGILQSPQGTLQDVLSPFQKLLP